MFETGTTNPISQVFASETTDAQRIQFKLAGWPGRLVRSRISAQ